ncbi:MAG: tetratricopeptide repeat protein [Actinobacteria bacterium]|nr:tetratricopeptide repeat protein [Actinomycetota bacterium]
MNGQFFNYETARFVLDHFFDVLNPGGYLFLGHSETLWKMSAKYSLVEMGDAFIYRKPLPMSLNGRRFIPDRRIDRSDLPAWVGYDRRACEVERRKKATQPPPDSWRFLQTATAEPQVLSDAMIKVEKLIDLGEFGSAIKALEEILKGDGNNAEAHFLLGLALEKSDQTPAAIDAYRRAIGAREDMAIAHFHLAGALERTGDLKNACSEYRLAAAALRQDHSKKKNGAIGANSLIDLCEWKIENLGGL